MPDFLEQHEVEGKFPLLLLLCGHMGMDTLPDSSTEMCEHSGTPPEGEEPFSHSPHPSGQCGAAVCRSFLVLLLSGLSYLPASGTRGTDLIGKDLEGEALPSCTAPALSILPAYFEENNTNVN